MVAKVKVCGVTSVADAAGCLEAGADAVGINCYRPSPRYCPEDVALEIASALGPDAIVVGVFVDAGYQEICALRDRVGFGCVQLHGRESPELLASLLPHAYKALRVRGPEAVQQAARFGGEKILLDAYVPGVPGGTGAVFDWEVARRIAGQRSVVLAGGLTPSNVAQAVVQVRPYAVDVASGVEAAPGKKDMAMVRAFVQAAKGACR